ncbi:MAG TPA: SMC-Scp complex subunit ScpB [Candidatus Acidoferrales bacterium]|jgi:segregation and condensation protein B|nr:SMC-Scp complex subunit ScpB [Candidatus Acidoferrales bacterium]
MTPQEIQAALEAIIYAADEPATLDQIANALGVEKMEARIALDLLVASYSVEDRGIEVRRVAGGWKFYTKPQHHEAVRKFIKSLQPPLRLTMPALETLAVIAYKQPATVPEINEIRGVNVGGVIKTLLEKRLITTAGRKEVIGRPILYRTSKQFMIRFGLSDLDELPSLKEFEQLAQAALGSDEGIAPPEPSEENEPPASDAIVEPSAVAAEENDLGELAEDVNEVPQEAPAAGSYSTQPSVEHAVDAGQVSERNDSFPADSSQRHHSDSAEDSKASSAAAGNSESS